MSTDDLITRLELALEARSHLLGADQSAALRLFAGFYEGASGRGNQNLVADLYAQTLVLFDYAPSRRDGVGSLQQAQTYYLEKLPWIECTATCWCHAW